MNQRIIVYGGSFNPPTKAHETIIAQCLQLKAFQEVWVMPSGNRSDKEMTIPNRERLHMLNIMRKTTFRNNSRLRINPFELQLPTPTETYRTVNALRATYPYDFWFVFGSDSYDTMETWEHGDQLRSKLNMLIIERDSQRIAPRDNIKILKLEQCDNISSTKARSAAEKNLPMTDLVSGPIANYIKEKKLYMLQTANSIPHMLA